MVLIFAISEEFSQLAFESRTFDFVDMLFNVLGVLFLSSTLFRTTLKKQLLSVVKAIV
jgi:glycopeptide antibiotics resistance protein